jgi:hypothetical protein
MTLLCDFEDPLVSNDQLFATQPDGAIGLASFAIETGARFTLLSRESDPTEIHRVVSVRLRESGLKVAALDCVAGGSDFGLRLARKQYQKAGALCREVNRNTPPDLLFAVDNVEFRWPLVAAAKIGRPAMLIHEPGSVGPLVGAMPETDIAQWARHRVAPSQAFIELLILQGMAFGYAVRDDVGRTAMVVVGSPEVVHASAPPRSEAIWSASGAVSVLRLGPP